ncbi:MAG: SDR family NAD(P)-dependent oxidoreductase, partial [Myxococcota bacterium]
MSTPHAPEGIEPLTSSSGGLEGRAYLVTGGGSGIGRACAAALATDGAAVTICGRNPERLADAVARIAPEHGGSIHSIEADVTDEASVEAAVKRAAEVTGQLDGCIANAGGGG